MNTKMEKVEHKSIIECLRIFLKWQNISIYSTQKIFFYNLFLFSSIFKIISLISYLYFILYSFKVKTLFEFNS